VFLHLLGSQSGTEFAAEPGSHLARAALVGFDHPLDEGGADNGGVSIPRIVGYDGPDVVGSADSEADREGEIGDRSEVVYPGLERCFWPAALILSALFAGMHLHLPSMGPLFLLSLLFSLSYAWTKTLLVPITMHACFNGVTIIILLLTGN